MNPAFSVIFLTTLIGVGQGLFLALYGTELGTRLSGVAPAAERAYYALGSAIALVFLGAGLVASFFHLGHPERAWRAAAMWRTSWLSREVIVLPAFMGAVFLYGAAHYAGRAAGSTTLVLGGVATFLCLALFVCTGMVYACIRFMQEWASPLTLANYFLLGSASGFMLGTAFAFVVAQDIARTLAVVAAALTLLALCTRAASLHRNARLRPRSTVQTATGIRHPRIEQKAQGSMGGSFNTREFFHGRRTSFLRSVKWTFLALAFPVPLLVLAGGLAAESAPLIAAAFAIQYAGLLAERWFFFAQANHPQNLYYQVIS